MQVFKQELENTLHKNQDLFGNELKKEDKKEDTEITRTISVDEFRAKGLVNEDTEDIDFAKNEENK